MSTGYRVVPSAAGENFDVMSWQQLAETLAHYLSPALAAAQYDMTDETMHDALGACHQVVKRSIAGAPVLPAGGEPLKPAYTVIRTPRVTVSGEVAEWFHAVIVGPEELAKIHGEYQVSDHLFSEEVVTRLSAEVQRVRDAIQAEWRKSDGAWIRERDALKAEVERHKLQSHCHLQRAILAESELRVTKQALESLKGERNDLQSELTKSRELIERGELSGAFGRFPDLSTDVKQYLAHQSAPAAKRPVWMDEPFAVAARGEDAPAANQLAKQILKAQEEIEQWPDSLKAGIVIPDKEKWLSVLAAKLESWPCWSCKAHVTMANRADADGNCPHCEAELDLEDWPEIATKEVRLLSVADDMSTCTLTNGDGQGYFYDRIGVDAKDADKCP